MGLHSLSNFTEVGDSIEGFKQWATGVQDAMSGLVLHFSTYISQCPFITVELVLDQHFPRTCIDLDFRSSGRAASSAPEPLMHHQP